jgi:hypothetical protein
MSDERTDGLEPHGEVVDGLLGLQARLRGDKPVAVKRRGTKPDSEPPTLAVVHDDVTVRLSKAVSTLRVNEAIGALSERLERLEALLDELERGIGEIEHTLKPKPTRKSKT